MDSEVGVQLTRYLLGLKVRGQVDVLKSFFGDRPERATVERAATMVEEASSVRTALAWEAKAAAFYWRCWSDVPMTFARIDVAKLPASWRRFGDRHSPLSNSPRLAVTSAGAVVNFLYTLALTECRSALLALGLDPGLGWQHKDLPYRDGATMDLVEPLRPMVDRYVWRLLRTRTFSRREFVEAPNGRVRLAPALARTLAESTLSTWEKDVAPIAEEVARMVAASAASPTVVRTRLTQADRKRARKPSANRQTTPIPNACGSCGVILSIDERGHARKVCDECLPTFQAERTSELVKAAREALSAMRVSPQDPAQSEDARRKRIEKAREMSLAGRAWEREHGPVADPTMYEREILPRMQAMSVRRLVALTGLSEYYLWKVRKGNGRLHPRFWDEIAGA